MFFEIIWVFELSPDEIDVKTLLIDNMPPKPSLNQASDEIPVISKTNPSLIFLLLAKICHTLLAIVFLHVEIDSISEVHLKNELPIAVDPCFVDRIEALSIDQFFFLFDCGSS